MFEQSLQRTQKAISNVANQILSFTFTQHQTLNCQSFLGFWSQVFDLQGIFHRRNPIGSISRTINRPISAETEI